MPVYSVAVTRIATVSDVVVVQADNESQAVGLATEVSDTMDFDTDEVQIDGIQALSADEAVAVGIDHIVSV